VTGGEQRVLVLGLCSGPRPCSRTVLGRRYTASKQTNMLPRGGLTFARWREATRAERVGGSCTCASSPPSPPPPGCSMLTCSMCRGDAFASNSTSRALV
jgi:hypothetical protein